MSKTSFKPKPIAEQTIVITGASSGIGLATAKLAACKGARVVLAARHEENLEMIVNEILHGGGQAIAVAADVSRGEDLEKIRDEAIKAFGQIDTWVNNAGTSIYGYLAEASISEERKLFETNFWGTRMGSQIAVDSMSENGGVLINLGSEVSVAPQPLLGMYSASKHAVKAFTEALRSELRDKEIPIEVCLVRPTAIDTPFAEHGLNRLDEGEPSLPEPRYSPQVAAEAILKCAVMPQRDVYVGGPARLSAILDTFFPRVKDMYAESQIKNQKKGTVEDHEEKQESLHHHADELAHAQGHNKGKSARQRSLYTDVTTMNLLRTVTGNIKETINELRKTH